MAITFHPNPGTLLTCSFDGFKVPEMVKTRPVIIISPRLRRISGLCTVVPLSTSPPKDIMPWHVEIELDKELSPNWPERNVWAKCDLVYSLRFERLDRFYQHIGKHRKYYDRRVSGEQLDEVQTSVINFIIGKV